MRARMIQLSHAYRARGGAPVVERVDPAIFTHHYFAACLACPFCHDWCCSFGVDVDAANAERILAQADALEPLVGVPRGQWFDRAADVDDPDMPSGRLTRTRVVDGACVFHRRGGRGCLLHAHALATGQDYHDLKPIASALFPLSFDGGTLLLANEMAAGTLVCMGPGRAAYDGVRGELAYYFGDELVAELDRLAARAAPVDTASTSRRA